MNDSRDDAVSKFGGGETKPHFRDRRVWASLERILAERASLKSGANVRNILVPLFEKYPFSDETFFRAVIGTAKEEKGVFELDVLSGHAFSGMEVRILPSGRTSRMELPGGAEAGKTGSRCMTVRLQDVEDACRGNLVCDAEMPAGQSDMFSLNVLWLGREPMFAGRTYGLSALTGEYSALVGKLKHKVDPDSGLPLAARKLERGEIGQVEIELDGSVIFDTHDVHSPLAGVFFRDGKTGQILGVGVIRFALRRASNIRWQELELDKALRAASLGQKPLVLWFTGLSGCGKSTVANLLEKRLHDLGKHTYLLDGDNIRHGLCKDLGFTRADRIENMRRITEVAKLMADAGLIVLVAFISPFRDERQRARKSFEPEEFIEIFVDTPLEICEARDIKGLYAKARAGLIRNFTGVDSPYEPPEKPEIRLPGAELTPEEMTDRIISWLKDQKLI